MDLIRFGHRKELNQLHERYESIKVNMDFILPQ